MNERLGKQEDYDLRLKKTIELVCSDRRFSVLMKYRYTDIPLMQVLGTSSFKISVLRVLPSFSPVSKKHPEMAENVPYYLYFVICKSSRHAFLQDHQMIGLELYSRI